MSQNELAIVSQEQMAIDQVKRLVNIVVALKNEVFVKNVDFGIIPGTGDKPTLLQPGMEKLLKALHLRAEYVERSKIEDFDKPLIYYRYECRLMDWETGICLGTAIGSANSHEKKWRWREMKRVCPVCGKTAIIKGSEDYGGGWVCWKKAKPDAGCGSKFKDGDPAIELQVAGQIENPDIMDQMNTIDKIAQKRSLGSAIKTVANVSMLYTVDVEDFQPYDTSNVVQGTYTAVEGEALQIGQGSDSATEMPIAAPLPTPQGAVQPANGNPHTSAQNGAQSAPDPLERGSASSAPSSAADDLPDAAGYAWYEVSALKVVPMGRGKMALLRVHNSTDTVAMFNGDKLKAAGYDVALVDSWFDTSAAKQFTPVTPLALVKARLVGTGEASKWEIAEIKQKMSAAEAFTYGLSGSVEQ